MKESILEVLFIRWFCSSRDFPVCSVPSPSASAFGYCRGGAFCQCPFTQQVLSDHREYRDEKGNRCLPATEGGRRHFVSEHPTGLFDSFFILSFFLSVPWKFVTVACLLFPFLPSLSFFLSPFLFLVSLSLNCLTFVKSFPSIVRWFCYLLSTSFIFSLVVGSVWLLVILSYRYCVLIFLVLVLVFVIVSVSLLPFAFYSFFRWFQVMSLLLWACCRCLVLFITSLQRGMKRLSGELGEVTFPYWELF